MNIFTNIRHANRFSATRLAGALALLGGAGLSGSATAAEPTITVPNARHSSNTIVPSLSNTLTNPTPITSSITSSITSNIVTR